MFCKWNQVIQVWNDISLNKLYLIFYFWVHYSSKSGWGDCYFGKLVLSLTKTQIQTLATFVWSQYHKISDTQMHANAPTQRHIKHKEMHMQHRKCLWRRRGNLWIMPFNHESLLILFFSSSVFTLADPRTTHGPALICMSLAWVQGLHYYFSLAIRRLQLLWNLLSSSFLSF